MLVLRAGNLRLAGLVLEKICVGEATRQWLAVLRADVALRG